MKRKLSRSKAEQSVGIGRASPRAARSDADEGAPVTSAQYKVIELSIVDEISIESALNHWVGRGWRLEGIHFAMSDSSKRPAMAFLLFTRLVEQAIHQESVDERPDPRSPPQLQHVSPDPWRRLRQLAGVEAGDDESDDPTSE